MQRNGKISPNVTAVILCLSVPARATATEARAERVKRKQRETIQGERFGFTIAHPSSVFAPSQNISSNDRIIQICLRITTRPHLGAHA